MYEVEIKGRKAFTTDSYEKALWRAREKTNNDCRISAHLRYNGKLLWTMRRGAVVTMY